MKASDAYQYQIDKIFEKWSSELISCIQPEHRAYVIHKVILSAEHQLIFYCIDFNQLPDTDVIFDDIKDRLDKGIRVRFLYTVSDKYIEKLQRIGVEVKQIESKVCNNDISFVVADQYSYMLKNKETACAQLFDQSFVENLLLIFSMEWAWVEANSKD